MSDYSDLETVARGAAPASANPYAELEARASGQTFTPPQSPSATYRIPENPINAFVGGLVRPAIAGTEASAASGLRGLWDLAMGRGEQQAASDVEGTQRELAYRPASAAEQAGANIGNSNWNPLNWPGIAIDWTGRKLGDVSADLGAPPAISTALRVAPAAVVSVLGMRGKAAEPYTVDVEGAPAAANAQSISAAAADGGAVPQGAPEPLGAPVEGGLPKSAQNARAAVLSRVGIKQARESAIQGDAKSAAVDYQMTKYDQPAGRAAAAQFQSERDALAQHLENMIGETGGTVGMDEDALANRGATIARPFDMLRQWFNDRTQQLYAEADARAGGAPITNLDGVNALIENPNFRNTLLAKDQGGLISAVQSQLQHFRDNTGGGFNTATAEQFRQWLNQVWTPDNKWAIGQLKGAIDEDVTKAAGEDIYAQARAIRQLREQTLENPKGIHQLFDVDPSAPLNRSTSLEKIPEKLNQLPLDQYANVLKTLEEMPEELQPDAQAALGEIRGQLLNRILQAGVQTSRGVGADIWGTDRVAQVLRTHAGKFRIAFQNDPAIQQGLEDVNSAGQILRVNPSYPGADAQAANAMKRGLVSRTLGHVGGAAGAAVGTTIGGPLITAAGGAVGESVGLSAGQRAAERAALKGWGKRVRQTTEVNP